MQCLSMAQERSGHYCVLMFGLCLFSGEMVLCLACCISREVANLAIWKPPTEIEIVGAASRS